MKKLLALLLALVTLLAMTACGDEATPNKKDDDDDDDKRPVATDTQKVPSVTDVKENPNSPGLGDLIGGQTKPDIDEAYKKFNTNGTIEKTVLVDQDGVKITANEIVYGSSITLKYTIENKTSKNLTFHLDNGLAVNGVLLDEGWMSETVMAGSTLDTEVYLFCEEMLLCGIDRIAVLEGRYVAYDDSYDKYDFGYKELKTSLYSSFNYSDSCFRDAITAANNPLAGLYELVDHTAVKAFDKAGVAISSATLINVEEDGAMLLIEFDNHTSELREVYLENFALNGLCFNYDIALTIDPNKKAIQMINLDWSDGFSMRGNYGITEISTVSFDVEIWDEEYEDLIDPVRAAFNLKSKDGSFDKNGKVIYDRNGIQILYKDVCYDTANSLLDPTAKDAYALLLVKNGSDNDISVSTNSNTLKLNGAVIENYTRTAYADKDGYAIIVIDLYADGLKTNGISGLDAIKNIEMEVELRREYDDSSDLIENTTIKIEK